MVILINLLKKESKIKNEKNYYKLNFNFIFNYFYHLIVILSTIGIETNKFNKLISDKFVQTKNIKLV